MQALNTQELQVTCSLTREPDWCEIILVAYMHKDGGWWWWWWGIHVFV